MVNLLREEFREVEIKGCSLHLGQAWYRKIQSLGLAQDYKDKSSEIGKWLSQFFGLPSLKEKSLRHQLGCSGKISCSCRVTHIKNPLINKSYLVKIKAFLT